MNNLFSIGEISKLQNISRQTLIFYDKIGLFCPSYVDPDNGYRYYSSSQLDYLDTICVMKKIGFSLDEIKSHMKNYNMEDSILALRKQIGVIERQIAELKLVKSRAEHRCRQLESVASVQESDTSVTLEYTERQYILLQKVMPPHSLEEVSLATKRCFVKAFDKHLPIYFQSGAIIPYERIKQSRYVEAAYAFIPIENVECSGEITEMPEGKCVCTYHIGDYPSIGSSYERILSYCKDNGLQICSDSYELAINDYLSTDNEDEYITKIMFYVER